MRLINLIFQSKYFHFVLAAHNEVVGRICFSRKNRAMHSSNLKSKMWDCWKTNFIPIISAFILVNSELRNISNDQMILKYLIINYLRCHLSFVIFAITLSLLQFALCLWSEVLRDGGVFKVWEVLHGFDMFIVDKGHG